jgi:hypothetical protein
MELQQGTDKDARSRPRHSPNAYLFVRLHGDGAAEKARKMVELMRSKGDEEGADISLRITVAIGELGEPSTDARH